MLFEPFILRVKLERRYVSPVLNKLVKPYRPLLPRYIAPEICSNRARTEIYAQVRERFAQEFRVPAPVTEPAYYFFRICPPVFGRRPFILLGKRDWVIFFAITIISGLPSFCASTSL